MKEDLVKTLKISGDKVQVIYNAPADIFKDLNAEKDKHLILSVGSLEPRKNLKRLISAFSSLKGYELVIVGKSSKIFSNNDIRDQVDKNQKIRFTGHLSDIDLVKLYNQATIFVYTSLFEGFGVPPLEAQACGTPVLVSDIAPHNEVYGDSALFCNPHNPEDIAHKMSQLLQNRSLRENLIEKGKNNVKRFSWKITAENVYSILSNMPTK